MLRKLAVCLSLSFPAVSATATQVTDVKVTSLQAKDGYVYTEGHGSVPTENRTNCSRSEFKGFAFHVDDPNYKSYMAIITAAWVGGKKVSITGSNDCGATPGRFSEPITNLYGS
ncbi:MAG: hypothetical protein HRU19_31430 [Pseudobacteriovorax sp.]|nr:hypothetical protein [Pseudobacteriovorax sp.]